jgi:CheY-like chemotaxis protein
MPQYVKHVLIIDDDPVNNMINQKLIAKFKPELEIKTIQGAQEALDWLKSDPSNKPDLVLLDINMPVMTGWEFLEAAKSLDIELLVVMLSSSIDKHDKSKSETYPLVVDYIIKPLNLERLQELFDRHQFEIE